MTEIVKLENAAELERFVAGHPKGHFSQSPLWGVQKKDWAWNGIIRRNDLGEITGTLSLLIRRVPGVPASLVYGCRGPVCDMHDRQTIEELVQAAKKLSKSYYGYVLKLDPDTPSGDREFLDIMLDLGFTQPRQGKNFEGIQPRYVFRLDIAGKSEEELLNSFEQKTRYNIRLAERKGVEVRICGHEELPDFARLMKETGLRDGFVTRPRSYFDEMLDNLGEHARLYMAYHDDIPIAGTLAIHYGDKVWYLYGASANQYRNLMPNYLLQWSMIRWALELNCRVYDFRGVSGDLSEDNPLYGLYRFKKGFNGELCEFIGELDLVLSKPLNFIVHRAERSFRHLRKVFYLARNRK